MCQVSRGALANLYRSYIMGNAHILYALATGNILEILESGQRTFEEGSLTNDMLLFKLNAEEVSSVAICDSTHPRVERKLGAKFSCLGWEVKIVRHESEWQVGSLGPV